MELKSTDKGWFQVQSEEVKQSLQTNPHIYVVDESYKKTNLCVIYFSSNEIYYPNTKASFTESIIKRNKFEWSNTKHPNASRHIYVRDIKKQWYIEGVNSLINTPEKLHEELASLSKGFSVYTIGSSAGGFAAILFGSLLKADRVYAFNAQFDLNIIVKGSSSKSDPILFKYKNDTHVSHFFNLSNFIKDTTKYYYFQSAKSFMDIQQFDTCTMKDFVIKIAFDTKNHGFPFLRHNLPHVLILTDYELQLLSNTINHPFMYSVKVNGFFNAFRLTFQALVKRIKKKWYDERKNTRLFFK